MSTVLPDITKPMTVTLQLDAANLDLLRRCEGELVTAEDFVVDSAEMANIASMERRDLAQRIDHVKKLRKGFLEPAETIIENARALFNPAIEHLELRRTNIGHKLLAWDEKEKARVAREEAERQAEARKARQAAEAKAAADRARAEEQARASREAADRAEAERVAALAAGNQRAAAAAAAEAAKHEERAAAVIENVEAASLQTHLEAVVPATPVVAPTKIIGSQVRDNWVAELKPGVSEDVARQLIVAAAAARPELLGLLKLDTSAVNKMAKALKSSMNIPGFIAVNRPQLAGSRK